MAPFPPIFLPRRRQPRVSLSSLPTDVLALIVDEVITNDRKRGESNRGLIEREMVDTWECGRRPKWADLVALSEVNVAFWTLCKPTLWKSIALSNRNNADLLHLINNILPRYGTHVRIASGPGQHGRLDTPKYICEALGISSRFGDPSPESNPVDIELLGERVCLSLPSYDNVDSDSLRHNRTVAAQRTRLLAIIFDRNSTPHLNELDMTLNLGDPFHHQHVSSLRLALGKSRLVRLNIRIFDSNRDPEMPIEEEPEHEPPYAALAELFSFNLTLEELQFEDRVWRGTEDGQLAFRRDADPSFVQSIHNLTHLRQLKLAFLPIRQQYISKLSIAPLTALHLNALEVPWTDFITFLNHFHSTLTTLHVDFGGTLITSDLLPLPDSDVNSFDRLKKLHLQGIATHRLITNFATSPLRWLSFEVGPGGNPSYTEWLELFDMFEGTLKCVCTSFQEQFEAGEEEKLEEEAKSRGIVLDWYW